MEAMISIFSLLLLSAGPDTGIFAPDTTISNDSLRIKKVIYRDPWISPDKFLHFSACTAIPGLTYHLYVCRLKRDEHLGRVYAVSLTAVIGLGKELYDKKRKGQFSWRDLCWDGLGLLAGYFIFIY